MFRLFLHNEAINTVQYCAVLYYTATVAFVTVSSTQEVDRAVQPNPTLPLAIYVRIP